MSGWSHAAPRPSGSPVSSPRVSSPSVLRSVPHFPSLISMDILVVAVRVPWPLCLLLQGAWEHRFSLQILVSGPLGRYPAVGLLDRTVALVSVFEEPPHCFPQRLRLFAFPPVAPGVPCALIPAGRGCFPFSRVIVL